MILVTLGTQDKSFHRLLEEIDRLIKNGIIQDKVVVQAGTTKFHSENMEIFDLIPITEFNNLIAMADILITHGGVGSIITALKSDKKVIAVARKAVYKEHTNDHQIEIIREFAAEGYLLPVLEVSELEAAFMQLPNFHPKKFVSNTNHMVELIKTFIDQNR